jgi:hypothetical protein
VPTIVRSVRFGVGGIRVVISEPVDPVPWITQGISAGRARSGYNERPAEDD